MNSRDSLVSFEETSIARRLQALRACLLRSLSGIVVGTAAGYFFWRDIWKFLTIPLEGTSVKLINTSPMESFITSLKVALIAGILASSPWVLWNIWRLGGSVLFSGKTKAFSYVYLMSTLLFPAGVIFCYFLVIPYGVRFFAEYTGGAVSPRWSQGDYAGLFIKMEIAFGAVFELPVLSFALTKMGLVDYRALWRFSRYAIVIIFIVAAFLTPPDPFTQIVLAIPLCVLYLISILVSFLAGGNRIKKPVPKS